MKLAITGTAGQGVKLLGHLLAATLANFQYNVALSYNYDSAVRAGEITAYLIFNKKEKIKNPIIENPDLFIILADTQDIVEAKEEIVEKHICQPNCTSCPLKCKKMEVIPFEEESIKQFKSKKQINMIALGKIIKKLNLNLDLDFLKEKLPKNFLEENIKAIEIGYNYQTE